MRYAAAIPASCALALALSTTAFAQGRESAPGQEKKEKKAPNQVVETGRNDNAAPVSPEAAAAAAVAVDRQFGKRIDAVVVTTRPDGTLHATLDESFMEATVVTRAADGSLQFAHVAGLTNASRAVVADNAVPALEEK